MLQQIQLLSETVVFTLIADMHGYLVLNEKMLKDRLQQEAESQCVQEDSW